MKKLFRLAMAACAAATLFSCGEKEPEVSTLVPDFSADKTTIVAGEQVKFTDKSTGGPTMWNWEFEGGTPATAVTSSPTVTYEKTGTFKVKLTVSKAGGPGFSEERTGYITVGYPAVLTADFEADPLVAFAPAEVQFTDKSTGYPTAWSWEFIPDGDQSAKLTSTEQNPKMSLPTGLYTVKLAVNNAVNNDDEVKTDYVNIIDPDAVSADFTVDHKIAYAGMKVTFSDASLGNASAWEWTFDNATPATSTEQNPTVVFNAPGKHKVKLVASNPVNSSQKEIEAFISIIPGELSGFYMFEETFEQDGKTYFTDYGPYKKHGEIRTFVGDKAGIAPDEDAPREGRKSARFERQACIDVEDHEAFNIGYGDFSYSFWAKVTLANTQLCFLMEGGGNLPRYKSQTYFRVNNHGNNPTGDALQWCAESNIDMDEDPNMTGSCWVNIKQQEQQFDDSQWHHYVIRRTGTTHELFVDGVLKGTGTAKYNFMLSDHQPLVIGAMTDNNDPAKRKTFFQGLIDDLVVYKRAISDEEVEILYNY